jgi:hypothetical protein
MNERAGKVGRYGGSRWGGFLGGPGQLMKASPGKNNKGMGSLFGALQGQGTPQVSRKRYIGMQDPKMSPGGLFRMKVGK